MIEFYLQIRAVHIGAVAASGMLLLLRSIAVHGFGAQWPRDIRIRYLGYTIDTVLLAAALMLLTIIQQYPFANAWLTVKLLLWVAYIELGSYGIRQGVRYKRIAGTVAAFLIYGYIITVTLSRNPWGMLAGLF